MTHNVKQSIILQTTVDHLMYGDFQNQPNCQTRLLVVPICRRGYSIWDGIRNQCSENGQDPDVLGRTAARTAYGMDLTTSD